MRQFIGTALLVVATAILAQEGSSQTPTEQPKYRPSASDVFGRYFIYLAGSPQGGAPWEFTKDGIAIQNGREVGTWKVSGEKLIITFSNEAAGTAVLEFKDRDTLLGKNEHKNGKVFHWEGRREKTEVAKNTKAEPADAKKHPAGDVVGVYVAVTDKENSRDLRFLPNQTIVAQDPDLSLQCVRGDLVYGKWEQKEDRIIVKRIPVRDNGDFRTLFASGDYVLAPSGVGRYVHSAKPQMILQKVGPLPAATGPEGELRLTVGELLNRGNVMSSPEQNGHYKPWKKEDSGRVAYMTGIVKSHSETQAFLVPLRGDTWFTYLGLDGPNGFFFTMKNSGEAGKLKDNTIVTLKCRVITSGGRSATFVDGELFQPSK